jgi:segregation and condensation protein A
MDEKEIMELITSEYSWEQVIYRIIAWEGLDPWNLDLRMLSTSFVSYIARMKELDFKIPAKYLIIAAVLLRMKSDHLQYIGDMVAEYMKEESEVEEIPIDVSLDGINGGPEKFEVTPVTVPPKRHPRRKIMITELIAALRSVMRTEKRRNLKRAKRRGRIEIDEDRIIKRIDELYQKIDSIMNEFKTDELNFSKLVKEWKREEIIDTFLPVIYLDHARKIDAVQEKMFDEILIRRRISN